MSRRSSRRAASNRPAFPQLPAGVQAGLQRIVTDHAATVARMLDCETNDTAVLSEKCATVMKQQQLSASQFLARFFHLDMLQQHAAILGKSNKGTAAVLSERIEAAWLKNKPLPANDKDEKNDGGKEEEKVEEVKAEGDERKRSAKDASETEQNEPPIPKRKKKSK